MESEIDLEHGDLEAIFSIVSRPGIQLTVEQKIWLNLNAHDPLRAGEIAVSAITHKSTESVGSAVLSHLFVALCRMHDANGRAQRLLSILSLHLCVVNLPAPRRTELAHLAHLRGYLVFAFILDPSLPR